MNDASKKIEYEYRPKKCIESIRVFYTVFSEKM